MNIKGQMKSTSHAWLIVFYLIFFFQTNSFAANLPQCSRTFSLAYHEHGMLYSAALDQGIDKDVALQMIRRSGCKVEVSVMPRSRIWAWIESGQLDFSMSGISNTAREKYASFGWYLYNKYYFLVRKDANVNHLADFEKNPNLDIGTIRSFRYSTKANQLVDRLAAQQRIIEVPNHSQLLSMIKLNRIQAMIIEPFNYTQIESKSLHDITHIIDSGDAPVLHGLIISKKSLSDSEQKKWQAIIDSMHKDGTILRILQKYFDPKMAQAMVNF